MEKLAVAEHAWENHHLIHWEETTESFTSRQKCSGDYSHLHVSD